LHAEEVEAVSDALLVPVGWVFVLGGVLLGAFAWWLRTEWSRNWTEHESLKKEIKIHYGSIRNDMGRIHSRIDWLLQHQVGMEPYPGDDVDEG